MPSPDRGAPSEPHVHETAYKPLTPGQFWIDLATVRADRAVSSLRLAKSSPTSIDKAFLWETWGELEAAAEHLRDASLALGLGNLR